MPVPRPSDPMRPANGGAESLHRLSDRELALRRKNLAILLEVRSSKAYWSTIVALWEQVAAEIHRREAGGTAVRRAG